MIRGVLFDLDGTLLDTAPDLVGALNHVLAQEGFAPVEVNRYRQYVSRGALGLINAAMPGADSESIDRCKQSFLEYYARNIYQQSEHYTGVNRLLQTLAERAIPWGIVTNKAEYLTLPVLQAAGLLNRAGCVICGDTLRQSKPHPGPVSLACTLLGTRESETIMVGDDVRDIQAGRAAGTLTVMAGYGYCAPDSIEIEADWEISEPLKLLDILSLPAYGAANER